MGKIAIVTGPTAGHFFPGISVAEKLRREKIEFEFFVPYRKFIIDFLAFFFEYFSILLSAGIELLTLLRLMKESFYRLYPKKIVQNIEEAILGGEGIANALRREKIFSPLDIRMIAVGETTGRLDEQMKMLAGFYYQEVQNIIDTLTKLLEPIILAIAGIIFLIIILALIGPIYELISQMGKMS